MLQDFWSDPYALPVYTWHLRRSEGRAEPEKLKAVETQLAKGGVLIQRMFFGEFGDRG
jgi:hypothetical protein